MKLRCVHLAYMLTFVGVVVPACSSDSGTATVVVHQEKPETDAGAEPVNASDQKCPNGEIVETHLPGANENIDVITLCVECDKGCDDAGAPCDYYGDECDFNGEPGVCTACCAGTSGQLRCRLVAP